MPGALPSITPPGAEAAESGADAAAAGAVYAAACCSSGPAAALAIRSARHGGASLTSTGYYYYNVLLKDCMELEENVESSAEFYVDSRVCVRATFAKPRSRRRVAVRERGGSRRYCHLWVTYSSLQL